MKRIISVLMVGLLLAALLTGCGSQSKGSLSVVGSTSVAPLMEEIGKAYEGQSNGQKIDIQSVGSSAGIKATIDGTADIGMSSRDLKADEKTELKETTIALDAIAVVVNQGNPVKNLTKAQLKDIFSGKTTNWSQVGGPDENIVVITREEGSGTRSAFEELTGLQEKKDNQELSLVTENALIADGNGSVKQNVASKANSIGYLSLGVVDENVHKISIDGVEATEATVKDKTYGLFRPFLVLTKGDGSQESQALLQFIMSAEGQKIVKEHHYISIN